MLWGDYLKSILENQTALDKLELSINGEQPETMPAILKASILMTDKLLAFSKKNMFVFPEQQACSFIYMLARTLYNIAEGRVKKEYDPCSFLHGEKFKIKKCVIEFICVEKEKESGLERLWVKTKNSREGILLEAAPYLQHTTTEKLSTAEAFNKEYSQLLKENDLNVSNAFVQRLSNYKTHLDGATVFVAPIITTKKKLLESKLDTERICDFLLLAQSDIEGNIKNLTAGHLSGTPAIVLCQDLYTVCEAMNSGLKVNAIFIEATQTLIDNQLDALDDLIPKEKSIVVLADQTNLTDLSCLEARGFNIWTWNDKSIPLEICRGNSRTDVMIRNSANRKIKYVNVKSQLIDKSVSLLYNTKKLIEDQSVKTIQVFQDLFEIALGALRAVSPIANRPHFLGVLEKCKESLDGERAYLKPELFEALNIVTDNLISIYGYDQVLPKADSIVEELRCSDTVKTYIVVPQNMDKTAVVQYLNTVISERQINFDVVYPNEYPRQKELENGQTIVAGWLNRTIMHMILNANITSEFVILLYETEMQWRNRYLRNNGEQSIRSNEKNSIIMERISEKIVTGFDNDEDESIIGPSSLEDINTGELEDIELILSRNKYRRFISQTQEDSVPAVPVSFVGDLIAFYRTGHTLLTATKLINEDCDTIEEIKVNEVRVGDFIIEKEAQRDIIRDIADVILKNSGYSDIRNTARKWKETLEVESVFSDENTIFEKLQSVGCMRARMTVHNWLNDNNMITPLSKDDIVFIAKAMEDSVLLEIADKVFDAGKIIKSAHIQAGNHLADKLRTKLTTALSSGKSIDSYNVWQPIEMDIENIGFIKLLKVIDVGSEMIVDASSTNRLIDANRVIV